MVKAYKVGAHISHEPDLILEEQLILSPGRWGGVQFSSSEIRKGIVRTNWNLPNNYSLFENHPKKGSIPTAAQWIGKIKNVRYLTPEINNVEKEGMYCDVILLDPVFAKKIINGAPLAFSVDAGYDYTSYGVSNIEFEKTALVNVPGCKDAFIQLSGEESERPSTRFFSQLDGSVLAGKLTEAESASIEEGTITDDSSKGTINEDHINQKTERVQLEGEESVDKSNLDIEIKGDKKKINMAQDFLSRDSVQLDDGVAQAPVAPAPVTKPTAPVAPAPVATPAPVEATPVQQPVAQPVAPAPVQAQPVAQPVQQPVAPAPVYAQPVAPAPVYAQPVQQPVYAQPVAPAPVQAPTEPSKEVAALNAKVDNFTGQMDEIKNLLLAQNTPSAPVATPAEIRQPALPQTLPRVADSYATTQVDGIEMRQGKEFAEAYKKLNGLK